MPILAPMPDATIHHNPACSNSRATLALLRERGIEPRIVEYLKTPLSADELVALVARVGVPVRELMRVKEAVYAELRLDDVALTDDQLVAAIAAHPIVLNRPIVVTPLGARLCRPPETVLEILPRD
jgi:arsenate reductase (glutaredoxin)